MKNKHEEMTQNFSTWGNKLLRNLDALYSMQKGIYKPITIQISLCEICDSNCSFCSVINRPKKRKLTWNQLLKVLTDFKELGAKSVELTGGGNPLLWTDNKENKNINDIIAFLHKINFKVGIITNSHNLKILNKNIIKYISWIRISLSKLDEGYLPKDFEISPCTQNKLSFSYIINEKTNQKTIHNIIEITKMYKNIKFIRIAGDCLKPGNNVIISKKYKNILDSLDLYNKIFIKDIYNNDKPFDDGCYVGMVRPYIAPHKDSDEYQVYICTSHVLQKQNYDIKYSLGTINDIKNIWNSANGKIIPYCVKNNNGKNWTKTCNLCYYYNNNKILYSIMNEMPDENFP